MSLARNTDNGSGSYQQIDNLVYSYDSGNKLLSVADNTSYTQGFNDGNTSGNDYTYDANGNLTSDANKGISSVEYNHLNLPTNLSINSGSIQYIYDATGTKLKKTVGSSVTEYAGNYVYQNGNLQFFNHPEGYVSPDGSGGYDYVYQYKDHLGNVRFSYADSNNDGSIDPNTEIISEKNYYPFGLQHRGYNNAINGVENNYFTFNDVEHNESLGLNLYEMDWRHHDPAIGRFLGIDKLAEDVYDVTPYRFGLNNPIIFSDPTGLWEQINGGYSTTNQDEIQRFLNFINTSEGDVSTEEATEFIEEDIAFFKDVENTYTLTGLTVIGDAGKATDFSIHRTKNEIAYYLGYTNYLYTWGDYNLRNQVARVSSGPNDGIMRTILDRENRGQYLPIDAGNHVRYVGGQTNARLLNFQGYSNTILSLPGGSGSGQIKPRAYSGIRPSGARNKVNTRSASAGTGSRSAGLQAYKGMSFKEFHMKNSHLYRGRFRGRGTYMTHMSMDWRRLTFGD